MGITLSAVARASLVLSIMALAHVAAAAATDVAPKSTAPPAAHCPGTTLEECTRTRVASLPVLSRSLRELAAQRPAAPLSGDDAKRLERFNQWLKFTADRADALAQTGASATSRAQGNSGGGQTLMSATQQMQEMQMSFNLQYLGLQNQMQTENRQFTMASNILKEKHDTAKRIISNIK